MASQTFAPHATFDGEIREALTIESARGFRLGATLHRPLDASKNQQPSSHILMLPGWSGPRTGPAELLVLLAAELARAGHTVLRLDLRGRGDATGRFEDGDLDGMIEDAAAGLSYLHSRGDGAVTVAGICSGANVALGLASLRPEAVGTAVALSVLPFQPSRGTDLERARRWKNWKLFLGKLLRPRNWLRLLRGEVNVGRVKQGLTGSEKPGGGERNLKDSARDIEKALESWKGRALFVWGAKDEEAAKARAHFEALHARGVAGTAVFEDVPGANHNFYGQGWRAQLSAKVCGFLAQA
ncbi:MAG: alpha/beta fold hydrolase [Planctomycetes bacterium]|nr:alpha/beta fold hydrolase [Planctomycetota bacterium]